MAIKTTSHPEWIEELLRRVAPYERKVVHHQYFEEMARGTLSISQFRGGLINFYPLIESFPKYMALTLAKLPSGKFATRARHWLFDNISVERQHAEWWKDWAAGFGVRRRVLESYITPPAEMDAINNYLWRICTQGSFIEAISAVNFAIEGPTGKWTRNVREGLNKYESVGGVTVNDKTTQWVRAHGVYDDRHPEEALEIIKAFAITVEDQENAAKASVRTMEYYALALDACYRIFR